MDNMSIKVTTCYIIDTEVERRMETGMNKIKRIRIRQNLTQQQLSERSGLSQAYINELERGRKVNPSIIVLDKLATGLSVDITELLEGENFSVLDIARNIDVW